MRSALLCVFVTLFVEGDIVAGDDFRPTPIPLDEWRPDERRGRAGTLHETIKTASPPTTVVIPAHYWEDALRHSVYLTLVRDKIDQLIVKGDITDSKENTHDSKHIDDQDLWEKIKTAPFDRLKENESTTYGDVTILARGRLLEESKGYRFTEDDKSDEKCDNDKCMDGVKAFWSVKRVRQRDQEMSPGKYHYELTFSVMSQIRKKQSKPYERPIRTFTVQESIDERVTDQPLPYHRPETAPPQISRPERAIWFHKNIGQTPRYHKRKQQSEFERLFSSLFDDDDDDDEDTNYEQQKRYKHNQYHPTYSPYSKAGYVGSASSEHNTHLKSLPYPYKPHIIKQQSHPPTDHFHQRYLEQDSGLNHPYSSQEDYTPPGYNKVDSTTRPAVLPTPLPPLASSKESYTKKSTTMKYEMSDIVTNPPVIHKQYTKAKAPVKVNYFPERLRPPIYNAPPGVFVTMDKKPFKPMPPVKMPNTKPLRSHKPIDFRPSPQVLDVTFSEPDPLFDSAFRPITVNYDDSKNFTEKAFVPEENKYSENILQNPNVSTKKPPRKQNNIKPHTITTNSPDIITAHSNEQDDIMEWADMLGIFAKTTPMDTSKEKSNTLSSTTSLPTSTTTVKVDTNEPTTQSSSTSTTTSLASTSQKPKKRTRPPPKFNKTEKIKKHKRITTTTTSTSTTTSTTTSTSAPLTTKLVKEKKRFKPDSDTKQQATITTVTSTTKTPWKPSTKATTTPLSTISTSTTENPPSTTTSTTTKAPSTESTSTSRSKNINRFRQSTLLIKGTSLKHDRWSVTSPTPEKLRGVVSSNYNQRRKGSNFQGYISSTPKYVDEERNHHSHIDGTSTIRPITQETTTKKPEVTSTIASVEESEEEISMDVEEISNAKEEKSQETSEETKDQSEYIFQSSEPANDASNEIIDTEATFTTEKIVTTSQSTPKGKKCKKKHQNSTTTEAITTTVAPTTTSTTTTTPSTLEDLLNDFSFDDESEHDEGIGKHDTDKEASQSHEQYFKMNDDLKELLDTINKDSKYEGLTDDEEYDEDNDNDDDDEDDDDVDDNDEDEDEEEDITYHSSDDSPRHSNDEYDDKRPLTLLELMAME